MTTKTTRGAAAPRKKATSARKTSTRTTKAKTVSKPASTPSSTPAATLALTPATKPTPTLVTNGAPVVAQPEMKKKELIDLVVDRSGIKKKDAKPVVEAMLAVLGETVAEGRELNLQPMGKLRINRSQEKPNGRVIVCKLRQSLAASRAKEPLAGPGD